MFGLIAGLLLGLGIGFYGGIGFCKIGIETLFEKQLDEETREKVYSQILNRE